MQGFHSIFPGMSDDFTPLIDLSWSRHLCRLFSGVSVALLLLLLIHRNFHSHLSLQQVATLFHFAQDYWSSLVLSLDDDMLGVRRGRMEGCSGEGESHRSHVIIRSSRSRSLFNHHLDFPSTLLLKKKKHVSFWRFWNGENPGFGCICGVKDHEVCAL